MYRLDKMVIQGFKSFYDRTEISLPERITAIVGPNGCGKSNISDAIHWVLGEQKVRTLRGEKMEDVIFNGSDVRKPLGMAEVTLFLSRPEDEPAGTAAPAAPDGGNGRDPDEDAAIEEPEAGEEAAAAGDSPGAPPWLLDGGNGNGNGSGEEPFVIPEGWPVTLQVTRRLFRDGQSEYRIDGARCRLRDVRDVLQRISVGSGASSIIEQGRVDQIVASKPRERRVLIEEAAGIAGFKAKKREAMLKLEATELNLTRLEDIISEVRRQINATKRQAARARRYARLMEERRSLERVVYHRRALALDERIDGLRRERAGAQDEESRQAAALARAEAEAERIRAEVDEGDRRVTARREAVHALDLQVDREERGLVEAGRQSAELRRAADGQDTEAAELARRARATREESAAKESAAGELAAEVRGAATHVESDETLLAETRSAIAADEAALEERRRHLFALLDTVAELKGRLRNLEEDRRRAGAAAERAEREAGEAGQERDGLQATASAIEAEIAGAEERIAALGQGAEAAAVRIEASRRELTQATADGEEARVARRSLAERLDALQTMDRDVAPQGRAARAAGESNRGAVADFVRAPAGLEAAVESCLSDLLSAAVVADAASAAAAAARLEGRAAFLIADRAVSAAPEDALPLELREDPRVRGRLADLLDARDLASTAVRALASGSVVVADREAALDLARRHPLRTFLAVTGEVVRPGGLLITGRPDETSSGILTLRRRMQEAREGMARAEEAARHAATRVEELTAAIAADEGRIADARRERGEREVALAEMRERRRALDDQLARAVRHHQVRREEAERERADAANWEAETGRVRAELAAAEAKRAEAEDSIRARAAALEASRGDEAARAEAVAAGRTRLEGARARLEAATGEASRLAQAAEELEERASALREEAAGKRRKAADLQDLAGRTEASLRRNLASRDEERARLSEEASTLEEGRRLGATRDREAKEMQRAVDEVRERRSALDVQLSRAESERGFLEQSCQNDLGQSIAEASSARDADADARALEEVEQALAGARAKIEALGPVNIMAVEEFGELEQRYTFLTSQQKDLQDSVRSLRETITRINRKSRERFQAAFEQIRANFQESFRVLFGGGRADLLMEEEVEDVLEAGVEVTAQPPGKRLQRIALLSGGEKALTAIALLFSIFRYRPSPFCILDEVDAPLDEVNIHRYTEMLRRMALDTQFVVITHNKRTMERADVLYGVTMEEPGVSRIVSVRFESDGRLAREDGAGEVVVEPRAAARPVASSAN